MPRTRFAVPDRRPSISIVAREAVDFRKAHDGLLAVIRHVIGDDPFTECRFRALRFVRHRIAQ